MIIFSPEKGSKTSCKFYYYFKHPHLSIANYNFKLLSLNARGIRDFHKRKGLAHATGVHERNTVPMH